MVKLCGGSLIVAFRIQGAVEEDLTQGFYSEICLGSWLAVGLSKDLPRIGAAHNPPLIVHVESIHVVALGANECVTDERGYS